MRLLPGKIPVADAYHQCSCIMVFSLIFPASIAVNQLTFRWDLVNLKRFPAHFRPVARQIFCLNGKFIVPVFPEIQLRLINGPLITSWDLNPFRLNTFPGYRDPYTGQVWKLISNPYPCSPTFREDAAIHSFSRIRIPLHRYVRRCAVDKKWLCLIQRFIPGMIFHIHTNPDRIRFILFLRQKQLSLKVDSIRLSFKRFRIFPCHAAVPTDLHPDLRKPRGNPLLCNHDIRTDIISVNMICCFRCLYPYHCRRRLTVCQDTRSIDIRNISCHIFNPHVQIHDFSRRNDICFFAAPGCTGQLVFCQLTIGRKITDPPYSGTTILGAVRNSGFPVQKKSILLRRIINQLIPAERIHLDGSFRRCHIESKCKCSFLKIPICIQHFDTAGIMCVPVCVSAKFYFFLIYHHLLFIRIFSFP